MVRKNSKNVENLGEPLVLNVQQWLNETYGADPRYEIIEENGKTGWDTIYALTRAFQIELGIKETADNFGSTTSKMFELRFPNGIHQQEDDDISENNIYGIIQGCLFCKGYSTGLNNLTLHFYNGTGNAIRELKKDAGLNDNSSTITLNIMKALLSMDYFYSYDDSDRTKRIQEIQRYLNRNYEDYIGLIPCDGIYQRSTNIALIYAIQAEEKLPFDVANGNFGETTKRCCPNIPYDNIAKDYYENKYTNSDIEKFIILMKMGLYLNNVGLGDFSSEYDSSLILNFQKIYSIPINGICNLTTWLALFISCGDINRDFIAIDSATIISDNNISVLKDDNIDYIGRYLSGYLWFGEEKISKALSHDEIKLLNKNNIRIFPIYQEDGTYIEYFTIENAINDANEAYDKAVELNLQFGTIIYFAVDCDVLDYQVSDYIIPYFKELYTQFMTRCGNKYRVGIYATRNTCTRVCNAGYSCSSFVSDMSTGYSGNLGFPIPENWAFDQFDNTIIYNKSNSSSIEVDKNGFSGRNLGMIEEFSDKKIGEDVFDYGGKILVNMSGSSISVYESKKFKEIDLPYAYDLYEVDGKEIGIINPNEFYVRFATSNFEKDHIHKVLFNNGNEVKSGYITENNYNSDNTDTEIPYQENYFSVTYNPDNNNLILHSWGSDVIFEVNKPVPFFKGSIYGGTLKKGDKLKAIFDVDKYGSTRPWCMYFDQIWNDETNAWEDFNAFVSVGIELGTLGSSRALY